MGDASHPPRLLTCPLCEQEFVTRSPNGIYCRECASLIKSHRQRRKYRQRKANGDAPVAMRLGKPLTRGQFRHAMVCAGLLGVHTTDGIMGAKAKPPHISDVRWRIELRRRANPGYYNLLPECPVSPPVARPVTTSGSLEV